MRKPTFWLRFRIACQSVNPHTRIGWVGIAILTNILAFATVNSGIPHAEMFGSYRHGYHGHSLSVRESPNRPTSSCRVCIVARSLLDVQGACLDVCLPQLVEVDLVRKVVAVDLCLTGVAHVLATNFADGQSRAETGATRTPNFRSGWSPRSQ